ncbi:hypothetical protein PQX77_007939 [Marasmius sp. AFHP31]|nr:hypothetical protein PQX77_007939 [Marasmius sp. AFHP31]
MPRPRLYFTKEQCQEANQRKNKKFYDKYDLPRPLNNQVLKGFHRNRDKILESRKEKRVCEQRAQEKCEIREGKKQRERANRERKGDIGHDEVAVRVPTAMTADVQRELEGRLEVLKQKYTKRVQPDHHKFLDELSGQAIQWKRSTQGPMMTQTLDPSPAALVKKDIESMLEEYESLEDEYFYCIRNQTGEASHQKQANFTVFKDVASKLWEVLDSMDELMNMTGYTATLDYCYKSVAERRKRTRIYKQNQAALTNAEDLRFIIARNRERALGLDDATVEAWQMPYLSFSWYSTYVKSLKTSLQQEVNNNAPEYLEWLYHNLIQWKDARCPAVSPLVHPRRVFDSLTTITHEIMYRVVSTMGYGALFWQFFQLNAVVYEIFLCITELDQALDEEEYAGSLTIEEQYRSRDLQFFKPNLTRLYQKAGF